jgi:hypothetical protein
MVQYSASEGGAMTTMKAIVRNGQLDLPRPIDLPDGTKIEIRLPEPDEGDHAPEDDGPMTAQEIAQIMQAMDRIEPLEMTEEELSRLECDRQKRKEWEIAHFDERAEKLRSSWQ